MGCGSLGWPPVSGPVNDLPHPASWLQRPGPQRLGHCLALRACSATCLPSRGLLPCLWASLPSAETPRSSRDSLSKGVSRGLCCGLG